MYRLEGELPPLVPTDPPEVEAELWRGLKGDLAFDVGARQGENIPHLTDAGFTRIIALEPDTACYAQLCERFAGQCLPLAVAISDHEGTVTLAEVTTHNLGQVPTLVTEGTDGMEWAPGDWDATPKREVPCATLDSLADDEGTPDLVVVDVEGHEAKVLAGAAEILARGKTNWLIEFHGEDLRAQCAAMLLSAGLRVRTIRHPHYPPMSHMWHTHGWIRGEVPLDQAS